jgi:hypothetical protein
MKPTLRESLLHILWKDHNKYLQPTPLLTDGTPIVIHTTGTYNDHRGGPDFLNAEVIIDGLLIKGDIEVHRSTSDWSKHGHTDDTRYSSVILHIVMDDDDEHVPNIPTIVLRDNLLFDEKAFWSRLFEERYAHSPELPCFPHNLSVRMKQKKAVLKNSAELRLDELTARYENPSKELLVDAVYEHIFDALGFSQNREPMKGLARLIPRTLLQSIRAAEPTNELASNFEALFFGVSGLLEAPNAEYSTDVNEYLLDLNAKWEALQVSYPIAETLSKGDWAFFRIRPVNSPHRRVAVAASLAARYFSRADFSPLEDIQFADGNNWWLTRTSFKSDPIEPHSLLGEERLKAIEINVLLPARIALQRLSATDSAMTHSEKALRKQWMETPSASSAAYCQTIEQELLEGEPIRTTAEEQGALYLYRNYCTQLRCPECPIGNRLSELGFAGFDKIV